MFEQQLEIYLLLDKLQILVLVSDLLVLDSDLLVLVLDLLFLVMDLLVFALCISPHCQNL